MTAPINQEFVSGTTITSQWLNGVNDAINNSTQDIPGSEARTLLDKLSDVVSIKDFGAVGDGVTDDAAAFTAALVYTFSAGKRLIVDMPIYISEVVLNSGSGQVICEGDGKILPHDNALQTDIYASQLLTFEAGVTDSTLSLIFDMRNFSKSAVTIKGDRNKVPYFECANITALAGRTKPLWAISISGDDVSVGTISGHNLNSVSTMNSGGATLSIVEYAKNTYVQKLISVAGFCAYLGNGENPVIDHVYSEGCTDNVIYSIAGSKRFYCGEVVARYCTDEVVIFSGDDAGVTLGNEDGYIGRVVCYDCTRGVGFYKSNRPSIGVIEWHVSASSVGSGSPLYIRPTQTTQLDSITVGELRVFGAWKSGAPIYTLDHGGVVSLSIGKIFARLVYDNVSLTQPTVLGFASAPVNSISIGDIDITVTDTTGLLTSAHVFRLPMPIGLTKLSSVGKIVLSNNGQSHIVRVTNANQDYLQLGFTQNINPTVSPPTINNQDNLQVTRTFGSGAIPSAGTWRHGDIVFHQFPSAGGSIGWVCVASGTPGTWKTFGTISA